MVLEVLKISKFLKWRDTILELGKMENMCISEINAFIFQILP